MVKTDAGRQECPGNTSITTLPIRTSSTWWSTWKRSGHSARDLIADTLTSCFDVCLSP